MIINDTPPLEGKEYDGLSAPISADQTDWIALTNAAYDASTTVLDRNYRKQFEKNIANFQSKHPAGSKYYMDSYSTRSRLFRPKSRVAVRKNESSLASALFSTTDVVILEAEDVDDAEKRRDAQFWHEIINYRLCKTIPWFMLVIGAFQESQKVGFVISKQDWEFEEVDAGEETLLDDDGNIMVDTTGAPIVRPVVDRVKDKPRIRLVEPTNFRFDLSSDWIDPIGTSPYLLELIPMFVCDVLERMKPGPDGKPEWFPLTKEEVFRYGKIQEQDDDTTRKSREGGRDNEAEHTVLDFEKVWVIENVMKRNGEDYVYYTMGRGKLLTTPEPLSGVYPHGRPYVRGVCVVEAHRPIPAGTIELAEQLQAEANDSVNLALDLAHRAANPMKYIDRNANTDLYQLKNRVIGGLVMTDNIDGVREENLVDVPASLFGERNRIDADFDDVTGVFSVGSVSTNRQLGETVGGMEIMSQFANKESEYLIRTFVESWVEPVLRQLVTLEQIYEEDKQILEMAMRNVVNKESDKPTGEQEEAPAIKTPLEEPQAIDVRVSVGFGNLNPEQRIARIMQPIQSALGVVPWLASKIDTESFVDAVFGIFGHKNGGRFFSDFTPPQGEVPPEIQIKQQELQLKATELQFKQAQAEIEKQKIGIEMQIAQAELLLKRELGMAKLAADNDISLKQLYANLGIKEKELELNRQKIGTDNLTKIAEIERKENELAFKARTGRQGI